MRAVGVIQAMAAAVVSTLLEAAVLLEATVLLQQVAVLFQRVAVLLQQQQAAVLRLQVAVIHQVVEAIRREVEGIRLEVAVTPCSQRSQAPVDLYRRAKQEMMSALRQTLLI
jgi:hypothetical protein